MSAARSDMLAQLATTSRLTELASTHVHTLAANGRDREESWPALSTASELLQDLRVRVEGEYPGANGATAIHDPLVVKSVSQFRQDVEEFLAHVQNPKDGHVQKPEDGHGTKHERVIGPDGLNELTDSADWLRDRLSPMVAGGTFAHSHSSKHNTMQLLSPSTIPLKIIILLFAAAAALFTLRSAMTSS